MSNDNRAHFFMALAHGRRLRRQEPQRSLDNHKAALGYAFALGRELAEEHLALLRHLDVGDDCLRSFLTALDAGIAELTRFRDELSVDVLLGELPKWPALA